VRKRLGRVKDERGEHDGTLFSYDGRATRQHPRLAGNAGTFGTSRRSTSGGLAGVAVDQWTLFERERLQKIALRFLPACGVIVEVTDQLPAKQQ